MRNSSHLLIIYVFLFKKYKKNEYLEASKILLNYIYKCYEKSESGAVKCMETNKFDYINGLIGQAWVVEAIIYAYSYFNDEKLLDMAKNIFMTQEYDFNMHIWNRIDISGEKIGYDDTYNHQFWFAAIGLELNYHLKDDNLEKILDDFFENTISLDFRVDSKNRLKHKIKRLEKNSSIISKIKKIVKSFLYPIRFLNINKLDNQIFENSYHIFDIYGLAIAFNYKPYYKLFKTKEFCNAVNQIFSNIELINYNNGYYVFNKYKRIKAFNKFYFSYNSPAFEVPFIGDIFKKGDMMLYENLLIKQYVTTGLNFDKNTSDIITLQCRAYELIRFLERIDNE